MARSAKRKTVSDKKKLPENLPDEKCFGEKTSLGTMPDRRPETDAQTKGTLRETSEPPIE
jgi:hypothetical protein